MAKEHQRSARAWNLALAIALGLLLLALSYVRIIGDAGSAAFGGQIINAVMNGPVWGTALAKNLMIFAAALALAHIGFALLCFGLAILSKLAWPESRQSERTWLLFWFTFATGWLLIANAAMFRWSSLGSVYSEYMSAGWRGIDVFDAANALLCCALLWLALNVIWRHAFSKRWVASSLSAALLVTIACAGLLRFQPASGTSSAAPAAPHVILIGIDSLRADAVRNVHTHAPAIDAFLDSATHFTDATTPLARTFPSWVSIISGRHPHTTGAVINLLPREMIHAGATLPQLLAKSGYQSIYAIDEVRFSNLDLSYGFDRMIAPPIGATDFLLSFFGDTPVSNLLANTWLGAVLFPYLHANRAAAHVYDPDTFIERLDRELEFEEPTFLAVHLTLVHWPYYWADATEAPSDSGDTAARRSYNFALSRVDRQFADLMELLERRGALKNSVVIVVSDHGESLGSMTVDHQENGAPVGVEYEEERLVGHGTSVFSPHQYQVLFAMRSYGNTLVPPVERREIEAPVSLEDLTPTVLDMLSINTNSQFDGVSLRPLLEGSALASSWAQRIRFTETEFNPKGVLPGAVISASAVREAATYYRVDPHSDRVLVRQELLNEVLSNRQFAALRGGKVLAVAPVHAPDGIVQRALLVEGGAAPIVVPDPGRHGDPAVRELWAALLSRFPSLGGALEGERMQRSASR